MGHFGLSLEVGGAMNSRRTRVSSALVAVSLVLAACSGGGSETSSVKPRSKNAALTTEVAPCNIGNFGPNGGFVLGTYDGKIVEGTPSRWDSGSVSAANSQKAAMDYASSFSLNGKTGWSIAGVEVYQAVKDAIQARYGLERFWSSKMEGMAVLMNVYGAKDYNFSGAAVSAVPLILTPTASAVCSAIAATTTSSTTTSTTTSSTSSTTSTTSTTLTPTTSTTRPPFVPVRCTTSSSCRIGDTGPGGGVVVFASELRSNSQVTIRYTEIAPAKWDGDADPMVGARYVAKPKVESYRGGSLSDWRVPTVEESRAICRISMVPPYVETQQCLGGLGLGGWENGHNNSTYWTYESLWTNSRNPTSFTYEIGYLGAPDNRTPRIRPARSWDIETWKLQTTVPIVTTTSTTVPPVKSWSLATPKSCTDLSSCTLGQTGPGGGVIISVQRSSGEASYVEMAPSGWSDSVGNKDPFLTADKAKSAAAAYRGGGFSNWTLPPAFMIQLLCRVAAGKSPDANSTGCENPVIAKDFGDGKSTRGGEPYWNDSAKMKTDFVSGRNVQDATGEAYVRPVRSFAYVPPTTTTTIAKTCAQGGVCRVGDISPSSNLIVSMSGSGTNITYTELASQDWGASLRPAGNTSDPDLTRSVAQSEAQKYAPGGQGRGWAMPTLQEMRRVFVFFASPKFDDSCRDTSTTGRTLTLATQKFRLGNSSYWVIDPTQSNRYVALDASSGAIYYDAQRYMTAWGYKLGEDIVKRGIRPVRTVAYTGPAMTVENYKWSPSKCEFTSPPTTTVNTVPVGCQQRGKCLVGDIGPHGGIIIAVNRSVVDGPEYTEMGTATSANADCAGTSLGNSCVGRVWNDGSFRTPFGQYPSMTELIGVAYSDSLRAKLNLRPGFYWTSRWVGRSGTISGDFTGNLKELGSSLAIQKFDVAYAINMRPYSLRAAQVSTAYFRGVIRWKCSNACIGW